MVFTMKLDASFAGTTLKDYTTTISPRAMMNYAAAIDDNNPYYFNDESTQGIIAHPMFAVACTWPISEKICDYINNNNFPLEIIKTQVHYTEHLEFHRPIVTNDTLVIKGKIASIMPHRAGTIITIRFDACNHNNQPVFTEHIGGMLRGVECTGNIAENSNIPIPGFSEDTSSPSWEKNVYIDRLRPYVYDGCTNIHFPIHTSVAFAKMVGLPDIIVQGTATLAYTAREIINHEADGNPHSLKVLSCRFTGMMTPPGNITIALYSKKQVNQNRHLFFKVHDDTGQLLARGNAHLSC